MKLLKKGLEEDDQIVLLTEQFIKFIKKFKLNQKLYFKVNSENFQIRNIDFKECLGFLDASFYFEQPCLIKKPFYFVMDSVELIKSLENIKGKVQLFFDHENRILKAINTSGTLYYEIPFQLPSNIKQIFDMDLVSEDESAFVHFKIEGLYCLNVLKSLTAIENLVFFRFFRDNTEPLFLSKSSLKISKIKLDLDKIQIAYHAEKPIEEFEVYYSNSLFSILFRDSKAVFFEFFNKFLRISSTNFDSKEPSVGSTKNNFQLYLPINT